MRRVAALTLAVAALAATAAVTPAIAAAPHAEIRAGIALRGYVNPFADPAWVAGRTDMGMDWEPLHRLPVLAVGDAVILGSDNHSGWPGKHLIWYQLTDGSHAGDVIYVAEHLKKLLPAGRHVHAGQQIAVAVPGYPYIEMGWADSYGSPRADPCYHEGRKTNSGKEMERFLIGLGTSAGDPVKPGPDRPTGKLC